MPDNCRAEKRAAWDEGYQRAIDNERGREIDGSNPYDDEDDDA